MDIPTPKGIVTFDIHKFGEQDWEYGSERTANCTIKSRQNDGKYIVKNFNISRHSYFSEPFDSLTKQLESLGYYVQDKPLEHIKKSCGNTYIYTFQEKNFYIYIRIHYG